MVNDPALKDEYLTWLRSHIPQGVITDTNHSARSVTFWHEDAGVENTRGLEALQHALDQGFASDNCGMIIYMEDDRLKLAAIERGQHLAQGGHMRMSFMNGPPLSMDYTHGFFLVDLAHSWGGEWYNSTNPPENGVQCTALKVGESQQLSTNLGRNFVGEQEDGTLTDRSFALSFLTDQRLPLMTFPSFVSYGGTTGRIGANTAFVDNGNEIVQLTFPTFAFVVGNTLVGAADFTPEEIDNIGEANSGWDIVIFNSTVQFTHHLVSRMVLFVNCDVITYNIDNGNPTNEMGNLVTASPGATCLKLKGSRWNGMGATLDGDMLLRILMSDYRHDSGTPSRRKKRHLFINSDDKLLLLKAHDNVFIYGLNDEEGDRLLRAVSKVVESIDMMILRTSSIGDILSRDDALVMVKTRAGVVFYPHLHQHEDELTYSIVSGQKVLLAGHNASAEFEIIQGIFKERGKDIRRELRIDTISSYLTSKLEERAKVLSEEHLADIKDRLDLKPGKDIGSLFGKGSGDTIWGGVGEHFARELFDSMGPIGWATTIIDGFIVWYRGTLRWENRNSAGGMEATQNRELPFVRYETPFNAAIALGRTARGWGVFTTHWGTGFHPNITGDGASGWHEELCHGAVEHSVLAEDKNGASVVKAYNDRNGKLTLKEGLKCASLAAELLEASITVGDAGRGFSHPVYRDYNTETMLPLNKWNAFAVESIPEEVRKNMVAAYDHERKPFVWAMLPVLAEECRKILNSDWFFTLKWDAPKAVKSENDPLNSVVAVARAWERLQNGAPFDIEQPPQPSPIEWRE